MVARAPKTWRTWTRKELDRLETLRLEGLTVAQIAAALGRTRASVSNRLAAEGIVRPLVWRERWAEVLTRPHTLKGAAAVMGVTVGAVKQRKRKLRRAGFDIPAAEPAGKMGAV